MIKKNRKDVLSLILYDSQCSNRCVFCGGKKMGDIENNIKEEFEKIDRVVNKDGLIEKIEISGNDPGEYEGLPDFVSLVKKKTGASEIVLATHGRSLADKKFLGKLIKSGVNHFTIPIYGHTPKIHDSVTKVEGSFKETLEGVRNIYLAKQKISFRNLIMRENQGHLKELFYFLSKFPFYEFVHAGIPCFVENKKNFVASIPDFIRLRSQLSDALKLCRYINFDLQLIDVPICLINFYYDRFVESNIPKEAYEHFEREKNCAYSIKGGSVIPDYRAKKKSKECENCIYNSICVGFFKTYVDSSLFPFRPIVKEQRGVFKFL